MDYATLFDQLKYAEDEDGVESILRDAGLLTDDPAIWIPLGGIENNFAAIGNQQSDPTGALVEKIINAIDAMLMAGCFAHGIDPESAQAPRSMTEAVDRLFGVRDGRLSNLSTRQQQELADDIHVVAVGSKKEPSYLIIDRGEGQTPAKFPDTFLSLMRSNKIRIPFVQGKFNSGGTGVLQFCGEKNYQLIVSRRRPDCPVDLGDQTRDLWGFTLVRRLLPSGGRRSSMYVYLAPDGQVPSFKADAIRILPGKSGPNQPAPPYEIDLPYGTCIKLYNYRWRAKTLATLEGRYELERFLQTSSLPFRLTETREFRGHYFSTTVTGGWTSATTETEEGESKKLEDGFPSYADLNLEGIGKLPYQIAVFKPVKDEKRVPYGVSFVVNGQVHGTLPSDFVTRRLRFDYLTGKHGPLLVLVDCTAMNEKVREDFFMASRDRVRRNEVYTLIEQKLAENLKDHPGLQELNQRRRQQELEQHLNEEAPLEVFQKLLNSDPTLANLFGVGDRLVSQTGPGSAPLFIGRKFPSFFRLKNPKEGQVKGCSIDRTCRVEFETDAVNDYFKRIDSPGELIIDPPNLLEHSHLWNGRFETRFRVPWNAQIGDLVPVTVTVTDVTRSAVPFTCNFTLKVEPEAGDDSSSGPPGKSQKPSPNGRQTRVALAPPKPREVRKEEWEKHDPPFTKYDALRIKNDGQGGYDYFVNIDNAFLINELARAKETDKPLIKFWFTWGLVLAAVGVLKHTDRLTKGEATANNGQSANEEEEEERDDLELVNQACSGFAQVIIPIIRTLYHGPRD
jgi:hypothetical protein